MKGSEKFKEEVENYLKVKAFNDDKFAESFKKENKSIDDCITYILNQVQSSGINGFDDAEIFSMASHYYMEDDVKVGKRSSATVVVNHRIELTDKEKEELHKKAREQVLKEEMDKIRGKGKKTKVITPPKEDDGVQTLF